MAEELSGYSPTRTHCRKKACSSNSSAKPLARRQASRVWLYTRGRQLCQVTPIGTLLLRNTNCGLSRQLMLLRRATASGTSWRIRNGLPKSLKTSSVNFPSNGCGYMRGGRRGRRVSRRCTIFCEDCDDANCEGTG